MPTICQEIKCPYFCSASAGYGCRRYTVANSCHLVKAYSSPETYFQWNEYALHAVSADVLQTNKERWQRLNNEFMRRDRQYADDRRFQAECPELFEPHSALSSKPNKPFMVGAIDE